MVLRLSTPAAWLAFVLVLAAAPRVACQETGPKVGDLAPPFSLPGSDGRVHSLAEHLGVRPVVLAWFPRAFTKL